MVWRNVKLTSFKEEDVFDGIFISLFGSLVAARLLFVIVNFDKFGFDILKILLINGTPGLSLVGGILGGILTFFVYAQVKKLSFIELTDYLTAPLLLALSIGKLGSFFGGVDVGTKTTFPLAIQYVGYEGPRHLVGLYEFILFAFAAFVAYKMIFAVRRSSLSSGTPFILFLTFFGGVEMILDNIKLDRLYFLNLPFNLIVSAILFILGAGLFVITYRKNLARLTKNSIRKGKKHDKKTKSTDSEANSKS